METYHVVHCSKLSLPRTYSAVFIRAHDGARPKKEILDEAKAIMEKIGSVNLVALGFRYLGVAELELARDPPEEGWGHYVEWEQNGERRPRVVVIL